MCVTLRDEKTRLNILKYIATLQKYLKYMSHNAQKVMTSEEGGVMPLGILLTSSDRFHLVIIIIVFVSFKSITAQLSFSILCGDKSPFCRVTGTLFQTSVDSANGF